MEESTQPVREKLDTGSTSQGSTLDRVQSELKIVVAKVTSIAGDTHEEEHYNCTARTNICKMIERYICKNEPYLTSKKVVERTLRSQDAPYKGATTTDSMYIPGIDQSQQISAKTGETADKSDRGSVLIQQKLIKTIHYLVLVFLTGIIHTVRE